MSQTAGRSPKMLKPQTKMMQPIAMNEDSVSVFPRKPMAMLECGHHCEVARSPMTLPKIDSTTDHPIQ